MFAGKVVVVTGAAGALGHAVFEYFASGGARVVAVVFRARARCYQALLAGIG